MKKFFVLIIFIILVVLAAVIFMKGLSKEDGWICQNGVWVKHGNPSAAAPTTGCAKTGIDPEIIISLPKRNQTVKSPLLIEGMAKGNWFFEAVFPVKLYDDQGNELATGQVRATGDWTTDQLVPFTASISFSAGSASMGTLILKNDNPSGMPEKEKQAVVPVSFKQ